MTLGTPGHTPKCPQIGVLLNNRATKLTAFLLYKFGVRLVRQECERQKCERHQCEANSANANNAKGSTVRRDKSANVNSANASSAMRHRCEKSATAVRMTTVRKRHCSCAVTCFTGMRKSPSSGIVKATFLPLCNPFPNHNLTEIPPPKP